MPMEERNKMTLQAFCEIEGTNELRKFDFLGKDGKEHSFYSLGSKCVIWASDRAHAQLAEGKAALDIGDVDKAKKCFNSIQYAECKKTGLPDFDEQGKSNWVPSLMVNASQQNMSSTQSFVRRNEMSYRTFCEDEGTTELNKIDFIDKKGKKHIFYSLGSKSVIWASDSAQHAIENKQYDDIIFAELKRINLPDFDNKGKSNWVPSFIIDEQIKKIALPFYINREKPLKDLCEKGTLYAHKINKLRSNSFSEIRNISLWFLRDYSDEEKNDLKRIIGDGTNILTTYEQLHAYTYCFGLMHEAKLRRAFKSIPKNMLNTEIEVIDYACGQGIATVCFANFIEENNYATIIKRIVLIDPSAIALSRASLLCRKVCPNALINTINLEFNDMRQGLIPSTNIRRFHLLSNILDMTNYSISHLADIIGKFKNREDIFICVSPWYHNQTKDRRQQEFMKIFNGKEIYHGEFNAGELDPDRTWTAYITVFKI